jgi:hypothetical protein
MMVRVLHDHLLYAFNVHYVQALQLPLDYEYQKAFCSWLLQYTVSNLSLPTVGNG